MAADALLFWKEKSEALGRNKGLVTSICPLPLFKRPAAAKEHAGKNGGDMEQPIRAITLFQMFTMIYNFLSKTEGLMFVS